MEGRTGTQALACLCKEAKALLAFLTVGLSKHLQGQRPPRELISSSAVHPKPGLSSERAQGC